MSTATSSQPTGKFIIYTRVSSHTQTQGDYASLDAQRDTCLNWLRQYNVSNPSIITDVGSALTPHLLRQQTAMIEGAKKGTYIIVYAYDRLARSVIHATQIIEQLKKKGVRVISVREPLDYSTPIGYNQLMAIFNAAELESRNIGLRVKNTMDCIRRNGGCPHEPPYGYKIVVNTGRKTTKDPREQKIIKFICGLRKGTHTVAQLNKILFSLIPAGRLDLQVPIVIDHGNTTVARSEENSVPYADIAFILNEYEIPARRGEWTASKIAKIAKDSTTEPEENPVVEEEEKFNPLTGFTTSTASGVNRKTLKRQNDNDMKD